MLTCFCLYISCIDCLWHIDQRTRVCLMNYLRDDAQNITLPLSDWEWQHMKEHECGVTQNHFYEFITYAILPLVSHIRTLHIRYGNDHFKTHYLSLLRSSIIPAMIIRNAATLEEMDGSWLSGSSPNDCIAILAALATCKRLKSFDLSDIFDYTVTTREYREAVISLIKQVSNTLERFKLSLKEQRWNSEAGFTSAQATNMILSIRTCYHSCFVQKISIIILILVLVALLFVVAMRTGLNA
jgi:hypothetical protein